MRVIARTLLGILLITAAEVHAQPDTLWTKVYEGGLQRDGCYRVIPTFDSGYLLGGYQQTGDEGNDFVLVKVDSACNQQWRQIYRWALHDFLYSIAQTPDSCYLMCGYSDVEGSTGVIAKVDTSRELVWTNFYGGDGCFLCDIIVLTNGNIVAAGFSGGRSYLVELDCDGEVIWQEIYYDGYFERMLKTNDGGYILAGESRAFGNGNQGYVLKADSLGEEEWHRDYGSADGDGLWAVVELENGDFVFGGATDSTEIGNQAFWLVKTDSEGEVIWERRYQENCSCRLKDLITLPDSGLMFVGGRSTGYYPVSYRLDSTGDVIWNLNLGPIGDAVFYSVLLLENNSYLFAGECYPRNGRFTEFWLVRTEPDSFGVNDVVLLDPALLAHFELLPPYPNPFNSATTIGYQVPTTGEVSISVYDLLGRQVAMLVNGKMQAGNHRVLWIADNQASGIYFCRMQSVDFVTVRNIALMR